MGRFQLIAAVAAGLFANVAWLYLGGLDPVAIDFQRFWLSTFDPAPISYPPTARLWFAPLGLLPMWPALGLWTILSAGAFFLAVRQHCGASIAAVCLLSFGSLQGLVLGQTPMLIGAAMLFALRGSPFVAGLVIGIAASIKPQLLVMAPLIMIVRRDSAMLGGSMVGGLSALAVQLALQGIQPWIEWYRALAAFRQAVIDQNIIMNAITPAALFERNGFDPRPALVAGIIFALFAVVRMSRRVEGIDLAALIVGTGILASPYALPHDTILLAPACATYILSKPGVKAFPAMAIFGGALVPIALSAIAIWTSVTRAGQQDGSAAPVSA